MIGGCGLDGRPTDTREPGVGAADSLGGMEANASGRVVAVNVVHALRPDPRGDLDETALGLQRDSGFRSRARAVEESHLGRGQQPTVGEHYHGGRDLQVTGDKREVLLERVEAVQQAEGEHGTQEWRPGGDLPDARAQRRQVGRFGVPGYETILIDPEGRLVEGDERALAEKLKTGT